MNQATKPLATFGSPIDDLELWRCAQYQLAIHSDIDAVIDATSRTYDLGVVGDRDGANTWMAITLRILHLASWRTTGAEQCAPRDL